MWAAILAEQNPARQRFREPAIVRFTSDTFMNEFVELLENQPSHMAALRAKPETWQKPAPAPAPVAQLPAFVKRLNASQLARLRAANTALVSTHSDTQGTASDVPLLPFKLYQPAHQRYYLLAACLVCRIPGQPDRHIETSNQERVSFVVRRVIPKPGVNIAASTDQDWVEYAFVGDATGYSWQKIERANVSTLFTGEEQNPLFAVYCRQDDGHKRRVLAGLIPVGKREAYVNAPQRDAQGKLVIDPDSPKPPDPRLRLFIAQVTEPWKHLIEHVFAIKKVQNPQPSPNAPTKGDTALEGDALLASLKTTREQIQTTSWYILLDFARLLREYIPNVWRSITGQPLPSPLTDQEGALIEALKATTIDAALRDALLKNNNVYSLTDVMSNLHGALIAIQGGLPYDQNKAQQLANALETITQPYDRDKQSAKTSWPPFLFPLADSEQTSPLPPPVKNETEDSALYIAQDRIDNLTATIGQALPVQQAAPPLPLASQPVMNVFEPMWFVVRCIYERANCGLLCPDVISDATEPFQMAGFFDPDAPARPIRIALPIDTTPAGLRKFDKNTAFMISDVLCGQIKRARGLGLGDLVRSVLPWPLHKDLDVPDPGPCTTGTPALSLGMVCSLSIPIITICALLLLMIIVSLLDIIFHWVPYFILCFPLPKFSAKANVSTGT